MRGTILAGAAVTAHTAFTGFGPLPACSMGSVVGYGYPDFAR